MKKFIYILPVTLYKEYYKDSIYKWLPKVVMNKLEQKLKPRVLCVYKDKETPIGYGVGMLNPRADETKHQYIQRILDTLNLLALEDITEVVFEDQEHTLSVNKEVLAQKTLPSLRNGTEIDIRFFKKILMKLCQVKGNDIKEMEILVLGEDHKMTKYAVMGLAEDVKYLTLSGESEDFIENLEEQVLLNTGLVLHTVKGAVKDYTKYDVIVNLKSEVYEGYRRIKKRAIVFDFSRDQQFTKEIKEKRKDLLCIDTFVYKTPSNIKCSVDGLNFPDEVIANTYGALESQWKEEDIVKLRSHNKTLTIEDIKTTYFEKGTRMSKFKNKCDD